MTLHSHDFLFLSADEFVNGFHLGVGHFLDLFLAFFLDILGEFSGLFGLLQSFDSFAAAVADGYLGILTCSAGLLDKVATPFLGEWRDRAADDLAVVLRSETKIGCMMAFSMAGIKLLSQGWIAMVLASGTLMDATWATGVSVP